MHFDNKNNHDGNILKTTIMMCNLRDFVVSLGNVHV